MTAALLLGTLFCYYYYQSKDIVNFSPGLIKLNNNNNSNKYISTIFLFIWFYIFHNVLAGTIAIITKMIYKLKIYLSSVEEDVDKDSYDLILFDYLTIKVATSNFSKENKLGKGGFGAVYKVIEDVKCKFQFSKVCMDVICIYDKFK